MLGGGLLDLGIVAVVDVTVDILVVVLVFLNLKVGQRHELKHDLQTFPIYPIHRK